MAQMLNPSVSVIVPMYNVERFLSGCVRSIQEQTLSNIEIILVDDGSPDHCGEIADKLARSDDRIRVIHQKNSGLGPARNSGLNSASGEFVAFVDSDDWLEPEMYESLYEAARSSGAQIVYTGFKTVRRGTVTSERSHPYAGKVLRGQHEIFQVRGAFYGALPDNVIEDPVPVSAWNGIYLRSLLVQNQIAFRNILSEDRFFNTDACRAANVIACAPGTSYCYRKDDQPSITKTFRRDTTESYFSFFRLLMYYANTEPEEFWDECRIRAKRCVIDYCRALLRMIETSSLSSPDKTKRIREVLHSELLVEACDGFPFYRIPPKQIMFYLCLRFGFHRMARLLLRLRGGC